MYSASKPHKIIPKAKGKKKLNIPKPPPREICVLVGEMVYQMRSALDHLAFDLVKRNPTGKPLPDNWFRRCEFPLLTSIPTNGKPPVPYTLPAPYKIFSKELPNISMKAFTFIEGIQPYYRNGVVSNGLRFLVELSNVDKHRYLHIIRPRTQKKESVRYLSGLEGKSIQMLERGAKIETGFGWNQSDRAMHVHRRYSTCVAFSERSILGEADKLQVQILLEFILNCIKGSVVPQIKNLIKNP